MPNEHNEHYEIVHGSNDLSCWCDICGADDARAIARWDVAEYYTSVCRSCALKMADEMAKADAKAVV